MHDSLNLSGLARTTAPIISVAMPVYNGASHLTEAIDSILAQTVTDFELIIIDDGSTDDSLSILREYEQRDQRIRLVSRENRNLATTLNDIIELARGKWIARMDQDDIALVNRFALQLQELDASGTDICGGWVKLFGTADQRVMQYPASDAAIKAEMLFASPFAHPTVMMRAELAKAMSYDKAWEKCEDYDLWERAANAGWRMSNVQQVLLWYRQHPSQITTNTAGANFLLSQKIRHRYWTRVAIPMGVQPRWIEQVLMIRDRKNHLVDLDMVDRAFTCVLGSVDENARRSVFRHIGNLYFLIAGSKRGVAARWRRINEEFGLGFSNKTFFMLRFLETLRIGADNASYRFLKRSYVWLVSRVRS